jgi:hypothetical protein
MAQKGREEADGEAAAEDLASKLFCDVSNFEWVHT